MIDNNNTNDDTRLNKPEQAETGSTYWESNDWQDSNATDNEQPNDSLQSSYQNNNNLTFEDIKNNQFKLQQKKSTKKPVLAALVIVVLLLGSVATAFAFSGNLKNSLNLLLKNPRDYYAHIENNALESSVDKLTSYMKMTSSGKDSGTEVSSTLSYDKETVGALLKGSIGMSISDLEAIIGIPLDSIGFDTVSLYKDKESYNKLGLRMNDVDLIFAELFMNYASEELFIHLPDLSPAYLKQSLEMDELELEGFDYKAYQDFMNMFTPENTGNFIKRYSSLIIGEVKDVTLTKDQPLTIGEITVESNLLTARFYPETFLDIYTKVLEEARNDKYILDFLPLLDISKEDFNTSIDQGLNNLKDYFEAVDTEEEFLIMNIYVADDGSILGRKLEFLYDAHDNPTVAYYHLQQKDKEAYEFYIKNDEEAILSLTGSHTKDNGAYSGGADLQILIRNNDKGHTSYDFDIDYKDIKTVVKNDHLYSYGSVNLSSRFMMGMEIAIEFDVKDDLQLSAIKLNMGKSSLVTLDSSTKYLDDFKIPQPDDNADYYDLATESDAYYSTIDVEEYISKLSKNLGLDLEGLFGSLLPIY